MGSHIIEIPIEYLDDFINSPTDAFRSYGDRPGKAEYPYFEDRQAVHALVENTWKNPFNADTLQFDPEFRCTDNNLRFIHVDLAHTGDACGISMCCVASWAHTLVHKFDPEKKVKYEDKEYRPVVHFDFLGRITSEAQGGEIIFDDVRKLIYELDDRGFPIYLITYDRFQSVDSVQLLRRRGFTVANLSLDRTAKYPVVDGDKKEGFVYNNTGGGQRSTLAAWESFKSAVNSRRVKVPFYLPVSDTSRDPMQSGVDDYGKVLTDDRTDYITWIEQEALGATMDEQGKHVVEAPHGTIDLLESVAGGYYNAFNNVSVVPVEETKVEKIKRVVTNWKEAKSDLEREEALAEVRNEGTDESVFEMESLYDDMDNSQDGW